MTHTPGPLWGPWTYTLGNTYNPNNGEIRDSRGHLLNLRAVMNDEDQAIMRAMAAAPDLLEALEEFVAQTYSFGSMKNTRTKAIHAITKAKGE